MGVAYPTIMPGKVSPIISLLDSKFGVVWGDKQGALFLCMHDYMGLVEIYRLSMLVSNHPEILWGMWLAKSRARSPLCIRTRPSTFFVKDQHISLPKAT